MNTESLVESWPSTEIRSNERSTAASSRRSSVCASTRSVGLDEAEHRGERRRDHPRALRLGAEPHRRRPTATPRGSRTWATVGREDRVGEVVGTRRQRPQGGGDALRPPGPRSRPWPITPVEATATRSRGTPSPSAAAADIASATARPSSPWRRSRCRCSRRPLCSRERPARCDTITGAATSALRVNRAAETASSASQASRPTSSSPDALIPHATPAARNPAGSSAGLSSRTPAGARPSGSEKRPSVAARPRGRAHPSPSASSRSEHQVQVLHRLAGRALPEVVDRAEHQRASRARLDGRVDPADVGVAHVPHARRNSASSMKRSPS